MQLTDIICDSPNATAGAPRAIRHAGNGRYEEVGLTPEESRVTMAWPIGATLRLPRRGDGKEVPVDFFGGGAEAQAHAAAIRAWLRG